MSIKQNRQDAVSAYLGQLMGKTVRGIVRDGGSEYTEEAFGLLFTDGTIAWIMCDPEGNGPGFLDIQKDKPHKKD